MRSYRTPLAEFSILALIAGILGAALAVAPAGAQTGPPSFTVENTTVGPDATSLGWHAFGSEWTPGATLTITVDDASTPESPDVVDTSHTVDASGGFTTITQDGNPLGLGPGLTVTVDDGTFTKELVISAVAVTLVDATTDTISGTAEPGSMVGVGAGTGWPNEEPTGHRSVTVDPSGNWTADFSVPGPNPGEEATLDIAPGTAGNAEQTDADNDHNWVKFELVPAGFAYVGVFPVENNAYFDIRSADDYDGETVTVTVENPSTPESPDYEASGTVSGAWVDFGFGPGYQVVPGDVVTMTTVPDPGDPGPLPVIASSHVVQELTFDSLDTGTGVATGTAAPGSVVNVDANDESGIVASRHPTADASGGWARRAGRRRPHDRPVRQRQRLASRRTDLRQRPPASGARRGLRSGELALPRRMARRGDRRIGGREPVDTRESRLRGFGGRGWRPGRVPP